MPGFVIGGSGGLGWRALGYVSAGVSAVVCGVRLRHLGVAGGIGSVGVWRVGAVGGGVPIFCAGVGEPGVGADVAC
jgi:hypothetical protein